MTQQKETLEHWLKNNRPQIIDSKESTGCIKYKSIIDLKMRCGHTARVRSLKTARRMMTQICSDCKTENKMKEIFK